MAHQATIKIKIKERMTLAEVGEICKYHHVKKILCSYYEELMFDFDLSKHRLWFVTLKKEGMKLLIDSQGYRYPRSVGIVDDE